MGITARRDLAMLKSATHPTLRRSLPRLQREQLQDGLQRAHIESKRPIALHDHTMHMTALAVIVVHRFVKKTAVVPHCERAPRPLELRYMISIGDLPRKVFDDRTTFLRSHVLDAMRMRETRKYALASGLRMSADDRMLHFAFGGFCVA